jgi:serine/threonine-protein kinase
MGAVYQAEHTLMRKRMAIKVLHPEMTRLPEVVQRFEREAMAAAHIDHPHVVTATDFGKLEDGSFFLALEYVEGKSLREVIAQGRLELGRALHIGRQIAAALSRAHSLKIVHRDLKPENVMLVVRDGDRDFVKVLDFGIAKVQIGELTAGDVSQARPDQPLLTQAGMVYGTPEYMAPEQALGQPVDARADLYALGCIMYEMLCGVRPFDAESKVALLGMQVTAPVPAMATKAPDANIPPEVEALVSRLLAKEASERLGDARELIDGITVILSQLVSAGKIDPGFVPPSRPNFGTNPGLISAIEPAPNLSVTTSPDGSGLYRGRVAPGPEPPKATSPMFPPGKTWMIAAGGGLVGILALVITIVLVLKGRGEGRAGEEGGIASTVVVDGGEAAEAPVDQRVKDAILQIDKGNNAAGIEALQALPLDAQAREDVQRALLKAYTQTGQHRDAIHEAGLILRANPAQDLLSPENIALRTEIRDTALLDGQPMSERGVVDEAFKLLSNSLGTVGFDDLYDIGYGKSGVAYPKAAARAKTDIARADRSRMTQALAVTVDLHAALSSCRAIRALLDRAATNGDERTLALLRPLTAPRVVGGWRKVDVLGCIHDGSLNTAISDIEARLKKR